MKYEMMVNDEGLYVYGHLDENEITEMQNNGYKLLFKSKPKHHKKKEKQKKSFFKKHSEINWDIFNNLN